MYGSTALPLPPPFAIEHHPLRLSSEPIRPQPSGGCNFLLVQPSAKSKICACQVYHHNRTAPGNVCDCGHSACFHIHTFGDKPTDVSQGLKVDTADKIRKLEESILAERQAREVDRLDWQREIRALRDALAPFYRTEDELQSKLTQMDAKLQVMTEQQRRLDEVVKKLDNVGVVQLRGSEVSQKAPPSYGQSNPPTSQAGDDIPGLTSSDEHSSASSFSRHQTPSETMLTVVEPESPRSSGILNLASHPRPIAPPSSYVVPRPVPQTVDEPRSSGFLGVDIADRNKAKIGRKRQRSTPSSTAFTDSTEPELSMPRSSKSPRYELPPLQSGSTNRALSSTISPQQSTPPRSLQGLSPPKTNHIDAAHGHKITTGTTRVSPYSRTQGSLTSGIKATPEVPFLALDVLANVSTASNAIS